jgi:beta-phosphoglucomutase-like phosphatase (HAD superfamily)
MSEQAAPSPHVRVQRGTLAGAIFDVDGVLVASPHEQAWREALAGFADPAPFTTEFYQAHVAGKPRLDGLAQRWRAWASPRPPHARPSMPARNRRSSTG